MRLKFALKIFVQDLILKANTMQVPVHYTSPMIVDHHASVRQIDDILMGYFITTPGRTGGCGIVAVMNLPCYVWGGAGQMDFTPF